MYYIVSQNLVHVMEFSSFITFYIINLFLSASTERGLVSQTIEFIYSTLCSLQAYEFLLMYKEKLIACKPEEPGQPPKEEAPKKEGGRGKWCHITNKHYSSFKF